MTVSALIFGLLCCSWYLFPGVLFPRLRWESPLQWIGLRVLLSVGANGLLFFALRFLGILQATVTAGWAVVSTIGLVAWAVRRRGELLGGLRRVAPAHYVQLGVALAATGVAAYWSWYFPPELWDSLFYHLPLARIIAEGNLFEAYWADPGRHGLLLRGASGMNLLPAYLSGFLNLDVPVYRLAPPAIFFALLAGCSRLFDSLRGSPWGGVAALAAVCLTSATIHHASDYYADLTLAAYLTFALALAIEATQRVDEQVGELWSWRPSRLEWTLAATSLFATMPKRSGLAVVGIPVFVAWVACFHRSSRGEDARLAVRFLGISAAVTALVSPYLYWKSTLPIYPGHPEPAGLWKVYKKAMTEGFPRLFALDHLESLGPHVATIGGVLFLLWVFRLYEHRDWRRSLLPPLIVGWVLVCLYGIWSLDKLAWFNHWMRYLLPVYGVACVWGVSVAEDLWHQPPGCGRLTIRHRIRRGLSRATAGVGIGFFVLMTPWSALYKDAFQRFGKLSAKTDAPIHKKRRYAKWGPSYDGWKKAKSLADQRDVDILSADTRIWYMLADDRVVYDSWSVPESADDASAVLEWIEARDIGVLIEDRARGYLQFSRADAKRGTAIQKAIDSDRIEHASNAGNHAIFVLEGDS